MQNSHYWGDNWNGEDLSIYSLDDKALPLSPSSENASTTSFNRESPSYSDGRSSADPSVTPKNLQKTMSIDQMSSKKPPELDSDVPGFRAAEAYVRPTPITTHGDVTSHGFDLRNCTFTIVLSAPSSTAEDAPTEIFLPEFHFPQNDTKVEVSGGKWSISVDDADGGTQQRLRWWHAEGEQRMTIQGVKRRQNMKMGKEEEEAGYVEQCKNAVKSCTIM